MLNGEEQVDDWRLLQTGKLYLHGQDRIFGNVSRRVAPGDGMYDGNDSYYLEIGASALNLIERSLAAAQRKPAEMKKVLDYACGFGRVLRWLCAAFPQARIVGADADANAVVAVRQLFDVNALVLDRSLKEDIGDNFDLIWVGSLATHLPEADLEALMQRFRSLLSANGVLVMTTHGPHVAHRIARAEKTYGLDAEGVATVINDFENGGYGFSAYPKEQAYGIAVCRASKLLSLLESGRLDPLLYHERGWAKHQDCVAAVKRPGQS